MSDLDPSLAGPSRRTPIRSLRQPALLTIATRNDAGGLEPPSRSDAVELKLAMQRKVDWRRKGERWMDRFCEETVGKEDFKRGARYIEHHQYLSTLHERHLNSLCSYPLCPNPPSAPYTSKQQWSISTTKRAITEQQGNAEQGFCSRVCKVRSEWVGGQLRESPAGRGGGWGLELMEEVERRTGSGVKSTEERRKGELGRDREERRSAIAASAPAAPTAPPQPASRSQSNGHSAAGGHIDRPAVLSPKSDSADASSSTIGQVSLQAPTNISRTGGHMNAHSSNILQKQAISPASHRTRLAQTNDRPRRKSTNRIIADPKSGSTSSTTTSSEAAATTKSQLENLIANLVIHERPTTIPDLSSSTAVSTDDSQSKHPIPSPIPTYSPQPQPLPSQSSSRQPFSARKVSSSLIATPTKLASSLISASRSIGPVPQLAEDSDVESEVSDWEVEMDGFAGLGEEEMGLFEQMRAARELMEE